MACILIKGTMTLGAVSGHQMPDQGPQLHGADVGRTARHDDDLQEHVRQLCRRPHHQAERFQQPAKLLFAVRHPRGHGGSKVRFLRDELAHNFEITFMSFL